MPVEFIDNSIKVKEALNDACIAWLYEASGEIKSEAVRNSRSDTGQLRNSWKNPVDERAGVARIGSPLQNAIWEEFGTGEFALNGDGRSGYWVYVKGESNGTKRSGKSYTLEEAKRIMAMLRKRGLEAYYTKGKSPNRALHRAFVAKKAKCIKALENALKGM